MKKIYVFLTALALFSLSSPAQTPQTGIPNGILQLGPLNFNGFSGINAAPGVNPTDLATVSQIAGGVQGTNLTNGDVIKGLGGSLIGDGGFLLTDIARLSQPDTFAGSVNLTGGFKINSAAPVGKIPIGDGTNYTPGDPLVQGTQAAGSTTLPNPVGIGGPDTSGTPVFRSVTVINSAPAGTEYGQVVRIAGTPAVSISGTPTVNANAGTNLNTSALALETGGNLASVKTDVDNLNLAQGSTTSGQKGSLPLGAVTTSAPSYTTAQSSPLSLNVSGGLRVDGSGVTQPVSGTVTTTPPSNASTNVTQFGGTNISTGTGAGGAGIPRVTVSNDSNVLATQSGNWTSRVVGNAGGIMDFAGQNAAQPANSLLIGGEFNTSPTTISSGNASPLQLDSAGNLLIKLNASGATVTVSGTVTSNIGTTNGLALDTSVNGILLSQGSTTSGQKGELAQGAVTTSAPSYTTAQTSPLSLTTSGLLRVDPSGVTSPVSLASLPALATGSNTIGKVDILGNAGAIMDAAGQNAASPANELLIGAQFNTSPTTITSGNMSPLQLDSAGDLLTKVNVALPTGANTIGAVTQASGPWTSNITQISGSAISTAATGVAKVGVVGNAGSAFDSAISGATAPANDITIGGIYNNATPIAPTDGQAAAIQIDQAGNQRVFNGVSLKTMAAQGTAQNSTSTIYTNSGAMSVLVQLTQTTTLTAGAVTFEVSYDGSNWLACAANQVVDPTSSTFAQIAIPYTVQASTNKQFLILTNGAQALRIRTSTAITGTGSVTPNYALQNFDPVQTVTCTNCGGGTGGTSLADQGTFTQGTTSFTPMGGEFNSSPTTLSSGTAGIAQMTSDRALFFNLYKVGGNAVSTAASGTQKVGITGNTGAAMDAAGQNAASPANELLIAGQFNTSPTTITSGNISPLQLDSAGNVLVNVKAGSSGNGASSATGSAVPAQADYTGLNVGGTLRGQTGVNPSGSVFAAQTDITSVAGTTVLTSAAGEMKVGIVGNAGAALDAAGQNVASPANELLIGGQFNTSPTTISSGNMSPFQLDSSGNLLSKINVALPTGANTIGAVTQASGPWTENLTQVSGSAVSTAATGVQKVGVVGNAGSTVDSAPAATAPTNTLQVGGTFTTAPTTLTSGQAGSLELTAAQNLKIDLTTIAGTAPTTAGFIDIKGADGNVFVRQATAANLNATVVQGNAGTNAQAWWERIGDSTNGPVAVTPAIGTNTIPPTFTTAGATNANPALDVSVSPNSGIPAIIQKATGTGSGSQASLATANFATNPTAGNSIVVVVGVGNNGTIKISDTIGNSFTQDVLQTNGTTFQVAIFHATNIKGGATDAVTVTPSASVSLAIEAYEVSGIIGVGGGGDPVNNSTVNQQASVDATSSSSGSSTSPTSNAAPIIFPNEISFGGIAIGTANQTPSAFNPWNKDVDIVVGGTPSGLFGLHTFSQPMGSASSSVSLSATITSEPWAAAIATFKPRVDTIGGTVTIADNNTHALTTNSTAYAGKFGLDVNLLGTLGTAFTTAGLVDIKGTDGNVFVRQTTGSNLHTNVDSLPALATGSNTIGKVDILGNAGAIVDAATNAAPPANGLQILGVSATALPTAATATNTTPLMTDKFGRVVVLPQGPRDLQGSFAVQTTNTTQTALIAAGAAGVFNDITHLTITNEGSTATIISLSDGTTTYKYNIQGTAGAGVDLAFSPPLQATSAATAWNVTSSATATIDYAGTYSKNK